MPSPASAPSPTTAVMNSTASAKESMNSIAARASATSDKMSATALVFQAAQAHWLSACLRTLLELRVADHLVAAADTTKAAAAGEGGAAEEGGTGGMDLQQLAEACGCTTPTANSHLYKVLRVLAQYGVLDELPGPQFKPNAATRELVQGEEPSLGHMAAHLVNGPKWAAWDKLPEAVRQGKTAFAVAHGVDVYQYGEDPSHSEFGQQFCRAMTYFTRHSMEGGTTRLQDAFDWGSSQVILDVGGGHGHLLAAALSWAGPQARGLLLDRQFVVDSVDLSTTFSSKGGQGAAARVQLLVGDARQPFPPAAKEAKVDTLLMKHFLSAFNDEDAAAIIANCKQVLAPGGQLLLLQTLVPEPGDREHNTCRDGVAPGLFAIEILAQCPGGAWRTLSEWQQLFGAQGMRLAANTPVGCNMNLMVWQPQE